VGCGGSDSSDGSSGGMPTDATVEDFCGNFEDLQRNFGSLDTESDASEAVATLQDAADQMEKTGTPEDIPDDARNGLEVTLGAIQGLPDDATVDDISNLENSLSDAEQKDADAFNAYLEDTCGSLN
ncbi:MAG: hypothetical protein KDB43_12400, partial [Nocardioidaceae bacterium]|nr:hypothetical protein [Nocardioidaceae bacterium]